MAMKLRCLHDGILFVFLQQTDSRGMFAEETKWGFKMTPGSYLHKKDKAHWDAALQQGRWGKVLVTGPKCEEVEVGDYICVEPQMWTNSAVYDGVMIRKTDESKVMIISKEKPNIYV